MNKLPKVSVITITYGHQDFILDTLKGVLMQDYNGFIEFIIANDNSPDDTHRVVTEFLNTNSISAKVEIKYTKHEKNLGMMPNFIWALQQATGDYIALCEGDDYWTDPLKLQKQVNFLQFNSKFILCCHYVNIINSNNEIEINSNLSDNFFDQKDLFYHHVPTLSVVFRNKIHNFKYMDVSSGDILLWSYLGQYGDFFIMKDVMAVYRNHIGGVWSSISLIDKIKNSIYSRKKALFYIQNKNKSLKYLMRLSISGANQSLKKIKIIYFSYFSFNFILFLFLYIKFSIIFFVKSEAK